MPIYNYECLRCDRNFEKSIKIALRDAWEVTGPCPECNYPLVTRKIKFTGSVWSPTANGGMK